VLQQTGNERTRFDAEPDVIRAELQAFASRLVKFYSRGSIPDVTVKVAPACFRPAAIRRR
jgi:hypothetical protein